MSATKANGTLMARRGLGDDHSLVFSLVELRVELRGLEPLTPCLQSMAKVSSVVHGLARSASGVHLGTGTSRPVGVGCGCHRGPLMTTCSAGPSAPRFRLPV